MDRITSQDIPQRSELAPLSFGQQAIYYMNQIEREKPVYNTPIGLCFEGNLDLPALDEAVNQLINRFEVLRTRFIVVDGQPMQEVLPFSRITIPIQNLQVNQDQSLKDALSDWYAGNGARHQLDQAPPLKLTLLRISPTVHVLMFDIHHILTDESANRIFVQHLAALYRAAALHEDHNLPPVAIPYHEYAIDEQSHPERWQPLLERWKKSYTPPPDLEMPLDFPRPGNIHHYGADYVEVLDQQLAKDLQQLTEKAGCTTFMSMAAILQVLLYRYTGQRNFG